MRIRRRRKSTYDKYGPSGKVSWVKISVIAGAVVLFVAAAAAVLLFNRSYNKSSERIEYDRVIGSASLPVITMNFASGRINQLFGYTEEMTVNAMRDTIYVLEETYSLVITAQTGDTEIKNISFKLYDLSGKNLIQISDSVSFMYNDDHDTVVAELLFDNVISENTEYNLVIDLTDKEGRDIYYYTRIIRDSSTSIHEQIEFVEYFHNAVYSTSEEDEQIIRSYLDTDYRYEDNTNLSYVYLLSNYYHVTWGDMTVAEVLSPVINLLDINGEIGCYRLDYVVAADLDTDTPEYINVSEYFRVRYVDGAPYLLSYERTAETIFTPSADTVATKSADLGIISEDKEVDCMTSPDGNISCFVAGGSLWMMNTEENLIRSVFSFMSNVNYISDVRELRDQHDIRIIQVTDDGDAEFMVYGYMNRGSHEGECGLGVYIYDAKDDKVTEEVFMQSSLPYQIMEKTLGDICYLSNKGNLYIMLSGNVYALNISSNETELIVEGIDDSNSKVSTGGRMLAWQQDGLSDSAGQIIVLDMETEETYTVDADSGYSIKILGFLGSNLVYGSGESGNCYTAADGTEKLLMQDVFVVNDEGVQTHDEAENDIYYVGSEDQYNRVVINCVDSSKKYADASNFTIYAAQSESMQEASTYTEYLEIRETVTYIEFVERTSTVTELTVDGSTPMYMSNSNVSSLNNLLTVIGKYYVYASGGLKGIMTQAAESIQAAYDGGGVVIYEGEYFYRRGLRPATSEISEENIAKALTAYEEGTGVDVSGITLTEAMYYLGIKIPLLWEYKGVDYIVYGYSTSDSLMIYNIATGEESYLSYFLADEEFSESDLCRVVR